MTAFRKFLITELGPEVLGDYIKAARKSRDGLIDQSRTFRDNYTAQLKDHQKRFYGEKGDLNSQVKGLVRGAVFQRGKKKDSEAKLNAYALGHQYFQNKADKRDDFIDKATDKLTVLAKKNQKKPAKSPTKRYLN